MALKENQIKLMKSELPYGERTYADGTKALFNRKYEVITKRINGSSEQVSAERFFYSDHNPPWVDGETRAMCESVLRGWRPR